MYIMSKDASTVFSSAVCAVSLLLLSAAPLLAGPADTSFGLLLSQGAAIPEVPAQSDPVRAALTTEECADLSPIGCYYSGAPAGAAVPLLIYYRGWVTGTNYPGGGLYGGHISGKADILRSSRAAFTFYKLGQLAREMRVAVLVTGSSDIGVKRSDVDRLQAALGVNFRSVSVAAHSGGYVGLGNSIGTFGRLEKIVLLDPFYSDFSAVVKAGIRQGAVCTGFYTPHNAARYKQYFSGAGCSAQPRTAASDHEYYVPDSLHGAFSGQQRP